MTARPRPRYAFSSFTRSGNSWRQGTHHVAQKFTRTTLPFCFPIVSARPFASSSPARRGAFAAEEAKTISVIPSAARKPTTEGRPPAVGSAGRMPAANPVFFKPGIPRRCAPRDDRSLRTFDRAAERLRLGFGDRLAREQRIHRVLQVRRGDLGGVLVVLVDASVVTDLAVLVDDENLGRALGIVEIRDLIARILQDRETEAVALGVLLDLFDGLGVVAVDADEQNALLGEVL